MSRKNKNKRFRGVGDDEILRAWNEARAADALVKKADIQEDDQKEEIKEISSPIVYLQEVVENMMGDDKETETSEEIKAKQIKEKAEAKKIRKEEKAKLLVERSQRIGGQNGKKNYADDDVNWVIRYQLSRSQISENVMIIDVANSVNQELITASLLEFAASDPAQYKQAVFPLIIGRGHFAGLHIKRNEDGAFSVSYIDPMGDLNPQVAEDAIDGFIKSAAGVIGNVADKVGNVADKVGLGWLLGKKSDDILEDLKSLPSTPSIRGANLVHSSISNDIVNSLNTALGVNPGSIQVSRNRLQSSISVPNRFTNIPESRETTNNHCGPILAELLVELANENIVVSKNRLRDANGNDLKDLSREISDRMGSRLREEHLTSLRRDNPNLDRALANRDAYVNSSNDFQGYATAFLAARALAGQYGPDLGNLLASSDSSGFNMNEYSGPQSISGQQLRIGNIHSYSSSLSANHYAGLYNNFSPSMVPSSWNDLSSSYAILPPPPPNYTSDQVQSSNDTQRNIEKKDFSDVFLTTNQIPSALHPNLAIHTNASPRPPQVTPTTRPPTNNPNKNPTQNPTANPTANTTENPSSQPSGNPTGQPSTQPSLQLAENPSSQPSGNPTGQPSTQPSLQLAENPSSQPSGNPTGQPSTQPSLQLAENPSSQPSGNPTGQPSTQPSLQLAENPSSQPSGNPTGQPSTQPSLQLAENPSSQPSGNPTGQPSTQPSLQLAENPSSQPSGNPTGQPSTQPSLQLAENPSSQPSGNPTGQPSTQPSLQLAENPSSQPSGNPTGQPSTQPSLQLAENPSSQPSGNPTGQPSTQPSLQLAENPSSQPSGNPTGQPSTQPSLQLAENPSSQPSGNPTGQPSTQPSLQLAENPSSQPSGNPTGQPSTQPSLQLAENPSSQPSGNPTGQPSTQPSLQLAENPSSQPSGNPTGQPSTQPSLQLAENPSSQPSGNPTGQPSTQPSLQLAENPSSQPSGNPTGQPSTQPSLQLAENPSSQPSGNPTGQPSTQPSLQLAENPSSQPSGNPTGQPSTQPSLQLAENPSSQPSGNPTGQPSTQPSLQLAENPSSQPSGNPTGQPSTQPSLQLAENPSSQPSGNPTGQPSTQPSLQLAENPSSQPSGNPTGQPSTQPSLQLAENPSSQPSGNPTGQPSTQPSLQLAENPSSQPSGNPTGQPSTQPSLQLAENPSSQPSGNPTGQPSTQPSLQLAENPSSQPSGNPTGQPSTQPSLQLAENPSSQPSGNPTGQPSTQPSLQLAENPSSQPSGNPTGQPSTQPSLQLAENPSSQPSGNPTGQPSTQPSLQLAENPSSQPSGNPTGQPSTQPSLQLAENPSSQPSGNPTGQPSTQPSLQLAENPSSQPSGNPTGQPSTQPSLQLAENPSSQPSGNPTGQPSTQPSLQLAENPSSQPSGNPTGQPSTQPSLQLAENPSSQPSGNPTGQPSTQPSLQLAENPSSQPSGNPTGQPSTQPSLQLAENPSSQPSGNPTGQPSTQPSLQLAENPSSQPSGNPTGQPSTQPSLQLAENPSSQPSGNPTGQPSTQPSLQLAENPSSQPSGNPTGQPSTQPSLQLAENPSSQPSGNPTGQPSTQPSLQLAENPSSQPSGNPTGQPSTQPSLQLAENPSSQPSGNPTGQPSTQPSLQLAENPSSQPSGNPTGQPSTQPSLQLAENPSSQPSGNPTGQPSTQPSEQPTTQPSTQPTENPTNQLVVNPTDQPTGNPTNEPTGNPTNQLTENPTDQPSARPTQPSSQPTSVPSDKPTGQTSTQPSEQPTTQPSTQPSSQITENPTSQPSGNPTGQPSTQPTENPTSQPSGNPTWQPSSETTERVVVVSSAARSIETAPEYVIPVSVSAAGVAAMAGGYAGYVYMTSIALAPFMALALHEGHIDEELMNLITQLRSGENLDHLKDNLNKALMAILPSDISDTERTSYAQQVTTTLSYLGVEENYNDLVASFAGLRSYIAAMKDHGHPINTHRTIKSILSSWLNLINLPSNSTEYAVLNKALERMREYEASEEVSLVPLLALSIGGVELGEELQQARVELSLSQSFEIEKVRRALKLAAKELVAAEDPEIDEAINDLVPNRFGSDEFYEYAYEAKDIDALSVAQNNLEQNGHRETDDEDETTELSGIICKDDGTLLRDDRGYAIVEMPACDFANGGDMKAEFSKQLLHIARTRDNGEDIYPVKILMPYRREGSNWKLGKIRITKKDLDNGEVRYGFVGTVHNPCSRQQLEQQLESLDQEVQDIIAECIYENPANGHNKGNTRHVLNRISSQNSFPVSFDARESGFCVSYAMRNLKHRSDPWAEMLNSDFRHLREDDVRLIASSNSDELNSFARPAIVGENAANLLNKRRIGLGGNGLDRDNIEDLKGAIAQVLESEAVRARGVRAEVRLNRDGAAIKMMLKAELRANEADLEKSEIFDGPDFPGQDSFPLGQTLGNEIANKRLLRNNWVQIPNLTNSDLIGLGEREEDDMKSDHPNKGGADDSGSYDDFLMREFSKRIESGNTSRLPKSINSDLIGLGEREDDDMKSDHSNKGGSEEYSYFDYSDKRSIETNLDDEYSSSDDSDEDDSDEDYGATIRTTSGEIFKTGSINSSRHEVEAKRDDSNSSLGFNSLAGNEDTTGHPNLHESSLNLSEISTSDSTRLDSTRLYDLLSNADEVDQVLNETTKTTDYSKPVEIATKPILPSKKSEEQTKKVEKRGEIVAAKPTKQNKEDEIAKLRGIIATKKDTLAESEKKLKNIENKWGQRGRHILDLMNNLRSNKRLATYTRLPAMADLNELYNEALLELKLGKSVINHEAGGAKMTEEELIERFGEYENILKEKQKCEKNVKEISDTLNFYKEKLNKALEDKNNTGLDDEGYLQSYLLAALQRKDGPPIPPISTASLPSHYSSANTRRLEQLSPENFLEKLEKDANFMQESLNSGENHEVILNVLSKEDNDVAPETTPEIPSREDNDVAPKSAPKTLTANAESLVSVGKAGGNARGGNGGRGGIKKDDT